MKKYFSRRTSKSRNSSGKKFRYGRFFRNTGPGLKAEGMSRHVPYLSLIWTGQWLIVLHWCLIFYFNRFLFVISVYFIFFWQRSEYYLVSLHLLSQSALFRPISKPRRRHRKFFSWPEKFPFSGWIVNGLVRTLQLFYSYLYLTRKQTHQKRFYSGCPILTKMVL